MKKILSNSLWMLAAGVLAVSCADYNETNNFSAVPDSTFVEPYKDLASVKSYINKQDYPNMSLGAQLNVTEFNKQELAHSAAVTNFDNFAFGNTLMSGKIVSAKGVMNFLEMKDLLDHVEQIGGEVFGSPIVANANQADDWLNYLTAPIEILVDYVEGKKVNFNDSTSFNGTMPKGKATIETYDNQKALKIDASAQIHIVEGFEVDSTATYTITFYAKADKKATFSVVFSGTKIDGPVSGKYTIDAGGNWKKIVIEAKSASGVTDGFLRIENTRATAMYIQKVDIGYFPDNHRPQTAQEKTDTINFALNEWCDGLMKINAGRIKSFDLIDDAIDTNAELDNGMYDIKHATDKIFWQDIFGSENYAPKVSSVASAAFEKYGGNPADLKFFISESGLDNQKKFESLKYWIGVWDNKGAKIDGINAKLNLTYYENDSLQEVYNSSLITLLDNLATTGKLVRLSNFDIKYQNAEGSTVTAKDITAAQRKKLADYYGYVLNQYMTKIPHDKQAGICKGSMVDTNDPVGLWSIDSNSKDWVRNATYKAFCDALSGKTNM